jgi:uncharacterized membrane protein
LAIGPGLLIALIGSGTAIAFFRTQSNVMSRGFLRYEGTKAKEENEQQGTSANTRQGIARKANLIMALMYILGIILAVIYILNK